MLNKFRVGFKYFVFGAFFTEIFLILYSVDILPLIITAVVCLCGLIYNYFNLYKDEETLSKIENSELNRMQKILSYVIPILVFIFVIWVFSGMLVLGREYLSNTVLDLINNSKFQRYCVYGITYPFVYTYLTTWIFTDVKPIDGDNIIFYLVTLFISALIGLLICVNWEFYSKIMVTF